MVILKDTVNLNFVSVRDRVRTKMERDILAQIKHPFIVDLKYGEYLLYVLKLLTLPGTTKQKTPNMGRK